MEAERCSGSGAGEAAGQGRPPQAGGARREGQAAGDDGSGRVSEAGAAELMQELVMMQA
jgi:hypothetical protein